MLLWQVEEHLGGGGGEHGGHSEMSHSGLHTLFSMFLRQVAEHVGGGGEHGGHSGISHSGSQTLFWMFLRQVAGHSTAGSAWTLEELSGSRPDSGVAS